MKQTKEKREIKKKVKVVNITKKFTKKQRDMLHTILKWLDKTK